MGAWPLRMRWCAATMVGVCAVILSPLRSVASWEMSSTSGSNAARAEMPVRSASMGWASFNRSMISSTSCGTALLPRSVASNSSSSDRVGRRFTSMRCMTSSKLACSARSWIS